MPKTSPAIRVELWKKLLLVSSWAGLGALARSPMGVMRAQPETRALIDRSMDEGLAVARASGHAVDPAYKDEMWAFYGTMPAGATASMQRDIMDGQAVRARCLERRDMPVRRPRRGRDARARVHVPHAAADGTQGPRPRRERLRCRHALPKRVRFPLAPPRTSATLDQPVRSVPSAVPAPVGPMTPRAARSSISSAPKPRSASTLLVLAAGRGR